MKASQHTEMNRKVERFKSCASAYLILRPCAVWNQQGQRVLMFNGSERTEAEYREARAELIAFRDALPATKVGELAKDHIQLEMNNIDRMIRLAKASV